MLGPRARLSCARRPPQHWTSAAPGPAVIDVEYLLLDAAYESLRRYGAIDGILAAWCIPPKDARCVGPALDGEAAGYGSVVTTGPFANRPTHSPSSARTPYSRDAGRHEWSS